MAMHLTRSDSEGCNPMQWMGPKIRRCGMTVKRMGMIGASVRKMKALTVKMDTVTLIGKAR
jgi:hypothetical protein